MKTVKGCFVVILIFLLGIFALSKTNIKQKAVDAGKDTLVSLTEKYAGDKLNEKIQEEAKKLQAEIDDLKKKLLDKDDLIKKMEEEKLGNTEERKKALEEQDVLKRELDKKENALKKLFG